MFNFFRVGFLIYFFWWFRGRLYEFKMTPFSRGDVSYWIWFPCGEFHQNFKIFTYSDFLRSILQNKKNSVKIPTLFLSKRKTIKNLVKNEQKTAFLWAHYYVKGSWPTKQEEYFACCAVINHKVNIRLLRFSACDNSNFIKSILMDFCCFLRKKISFEVLKVVYWTIKKAKVINCNNN